MNKSLAKRRRALIIASVFASAVVCFALGLQWEIEQVIIPTALLFSLGVGLSFPIYVCAECKHAWIRIGGRNKPCPKCKSTNFTGPDTFLCLSKGRLRLFAEIPLGVMLLFLGGIRLLPLPVFLIHILIGIFAPKRDRLLNRTMILFLVLLFVPIDIEVGGFHGPHFGLIRKGPRLVRLVKGLVSIDYCVERYGDFIAGGCVVYGNEPEWLLVWDDAGLTSSKARSSRAAETK